MGQPDPRRTSNCLKGDDFLVRIAGLLTRVMGRSRWPRRGGDAVVTVSGRVSERRDSDSERELLVARADQALYRAKRLGRNRVERR